MLICIRAFSGTSEVALEGDAPKSGIDFEKVTEETSHVREIWRLLSRFGEGRMDDERARGRARSLAARRAKAFAHAQAMLPVIEQARTEETQRSGDWTYRSLADWLNARDHKTLRGKAWRHQSVWELLHIEHGQIDQAQIERDEKLAVLRRGAARLWRGRFESDDVREARRKIDEEFSATVLHAKAMGAALRGERHHLRDRIKRTPTAGPQGDATSSA